MSATIDGTAWTAVRVGAPTDRSGPSEVIGSDCVHTLRISLKGMNGPGTYSVSLAEYWTEPQSPLVWSVTSSGGSGSLTVTTLTRSTISGTFTLALAPNQGTAGTKVITNGSFDVSF